MHLSPLIGAARYLGQKLQRAEVEAVEGFGDQVERLNLDSDVELKLNSEPGFKIPDSKFKIQHNKNEIKYLRLNIRRACRAFNFGIQVERLS